MQNTDVFPPLEQETLLFFPPRRLKTPIFSPPFAVEKRRCSPRTTVKYAAATLHSCAENDDAFPPDEPLQNADAGDGDRTPKSLRIDEVALFAYNIGSLQTFVDSIHAFCASTGLSINVDKTKFMLVRTHKQENQPQLMYQGQPIGHVDSFKYLGIDIPSNHAWGKCVDSRIDAGYAKYYQFENMCMQNNIKRWELRAIVFKTCVVQTILYGVEVWGGSISAHTWNDIEKIQKKFICKHLGVKKTTPYSVLLLETGLRPLEISALKQMYAYIIKVKKMPPTRIPHIAWETGCAPQKNQEKQIFGF